MKLPRKIWFLFAKRLASSFVLTGICSYVAGGFLAGAMLCECGDGVIGNILGRLFIGIITCFLSVITGGYPPTTTAGGDTLSVWPYILGCWIFFFLFDISIYIIKIFYIQKVISQINSNRQSESE